MVKALLYIFAVLGLLASPVYAQAAQKDCGSMSGSTMSMTSHGMSPDMKMADGSACCNHNKTDTSSKDKACFNNCIAMCGISVSSATDGSILLPVLAIERVSFNDQAPELFTNEPGLVVPPPKSRA